jgi:hypothetical protein
MIGALGLGKHHEIGLRASLDQSLQVTQTVRRVEAVDADRIGHAARMRDFEIVEDRRSRAALLGRDHGILKIDDQNVRASLSRFLEAVWTGARRKQPGPDSLRHVASPCPLWVER